MSRLAYARIIENTHHAIKAFPYINPCMRTNHWPLSAGEKTLKKRLTGYL